MQAMASTPAAAWSYTATTPIDESGAEVPMESARTWLPHSGAILGALLRLDARVPASSVMVARSALTAVGGFDPGAGPVEDYDLFFRLASRFDAVAVDQRLCRSRLRPGSYQGDRIAAHRAWQRAYSGVLATRPPASLRQTCAVAIHRHRHCGDSRRSIVRLKRQSPSKKSRE